MADIVQLARLVGPTHWKDVDVDTLDAGLYDVVMEASGVEYERPDPARVAELKAKIYGGFLHDGSQRGPVAS